MAGAGAGGGGRFVKTALPMFGFVIISWLGLSQLMESKLRIRVSQCCGCCPSPCAVRAPHKQTQTLTANAHQRKHTTL